MSDPGGPSTHPLVTCAAAESPTLGLSHLQFEAMIVAGRAMKANSRGAIDLLHASRDSAMSKCQSTTSDGADRIARDTWCSIQCAQYIRRVDGAIRSARISSR